MKILNYAVVLCVLNINSSFAIRGETSKVFPKALNKSVVAILKKREVEFTHTCTGTILNQNTILTAAHCFDDKIFNLKIAYQNKEYSVSKVKIHSGYKREDIIDPDWGYVYDIKIENDIALIETVENLPADFVDVASRNAEIQKDTKLLISGLGQTANIFGMGTGEGVYRVSAETYADTLSNDRIIIDDGRTGGCQGDSGGPLWAKIDSKWQQIAITSQGDCNVQTQFERINLKKVFQSKYKVTNIDYLQDSKH